MLRSNWLMAQVLALGLAAGCASGGSGGAAGAAGEAHAEASESAKCADCARCPFEGIKIAVAVVHPTNGNHASGVVRFTEVEGGVMVVADLEGLTPNAKHAFHIHEFGDASSADGASAGSHYNPGGHAHGAPGAAERHAGDLGNVETDAHGKAHYEVLAAGATIAGRHDPILGRSVILHAKVDDFSQPVGNAGARIGCGVIGVAKPAAK